VSITIRRPPSAVLNCQAKRRLHRKLPGDAITPAAGTSRTASSSASGPPARSARASISSSCAVAHRLMRISTHVGDAGSMVGSTPMALNSSGQPTCARAVAAAAGARTTTTITSSRATARVMMRRLCIPPHWERQARTDA